MVPVLKGCSEGSQQRPYDDGRNPSEIGNFAYKLDRFSESHRRMPFGWGLVSLASSC